MLVTRVMVANVVMDSRVVSSSYALIKYCYGESHCFPSWRVYRRPYDTRNDEVRRKCWEDYRLLVILLVTLRNLIVRVSYYLDGVSTDLSKPIEGFVVGGTGV